MSVLVISMPLCSRHNAAVLDELSCCPSVGVWVSMGGWLDEGHVLLSSGNRWPHRVTSPHDQWRDRHEWLCDYITLINLLRGLQSEPEDLIRHDIFFLHIIADSLMWKGFTIRSMSSRKHFCQSDCPVLWWWLTTRPPCGPDQLSHRDKKNELQWQYEHQNGPLQTCFYTAH